MTEDEGPRPLSMETLYLDLELFDLAARNSAPLEPRTMVVPIGERFQLNPASRPGNA